MIVSKQNQFFFLQKPTAKVLACVLVLQEAIAGCHIQSGHGLHQRSPFLYHCLLKVCMLLYLKIYWEKTLSSMTSLQTA